MNAQQQLLQERLDAFAVDDDGAQFTFAQRLARENGWSLELAERVVAEYKRFVFLCIEAGHPCTPSEHVDQAWHLHLTFTRSYWERLCGQVLQRPLHHEPTRGGESEKSKFDDWYARTKASYEHFFGSPPPTDIWPPHEQRFGRDLHWKRINTTEHWIIPKRPILGSTLAALLFTVAISAVGCSGKPGGPLSLTTKLLVLGGMAVVYLPILAVAVRHARAEEDPGHAVRRWIAACLLFLGAAIGLPALLDRWQIPDLGLPEVENNVLSVLALVLFLLAGLLSANWESGRGGWSGCGAGGGCGGCGGGGCGGCGGCGS